jgi:hypothetical protein
MKTTTIINFTMIAMMVIQFFGITLGLNHHFPLYISLSLAIITTAITGLIYYLFWSVDFMLPIE